MARRGLDLKRQCEEVVWRGRRCEAGGQVDLGGDFEYARDGEGQGT